MRSYRCIPFHASDRDSGRGRYARATYHIASSFAHSPPFQAPPPFAYQADSGSSPDPAPNHLLVTASFGRILPNSLLSLFLPARRLNVHPSLLPFYRGPAPIQHTLIDGRRETGVCVIEMTERKKGIDSGAIWRSERMVCRSPSR